MEEKQPIVILVHGTFSNKVKEENLKPNKSWSRIFFELFWELISLIFKPRSPEKLDLPDQGDQWWQIGSSFTDFLIQEGCNRGFLVAGDATHIANYQNSQDIDLTLPEHLRVFKWSSENSERDRFRAGSELLKVLCELEKEGRDYHLVGHSHGGSVIWAALKQSIMLRWNSFKGSEILRLNRLKSWTTVGTPFLHYRPVWLGLWYGKFITTLFFLICVLSSVGSSYFVINRFPHEFSDFTAPLTSWVLAFHHAPDWVIETIQSSEFIQFLYSIWNGPVPFTTWLKSAIVIVGGTLLLASPFILFYLTIRAYRTEAREVRREYFAQNQAILDFGGIWLGIWSREDEAINGLRNSTKIANQRILPSLTIPRDVVFVSDRWFFAARFFMRLFARTFYDPMIKFGDRLLLDRIAKGAQGLNRFGARVIAVSESPVLIDGYRPPPLPAEIDEILIDTANCALGKNLSNLSSVLRSELSKISNGTSNLTESRDTVLKELKGGELVHNSYFDNEYVRNAMVQHISSSSLDGIQVQEKSTSSCRGIASASFQFQLVWAPTLMFICIGLLGFAEFLFTDSVILTILIIVLINGIRLIRLSSNRKDSASRRPAMFWGVGFIVVFTIALIRIINDFLISISTT
ncbi:MAG: hypothetical protein P1U89_21205 [Verrucomicrobiales bacterium]|nr:hypothetical protein [Verrucomicrobiales bacterium]